MKGKYYEIIESVLSKSEKRFLIQNLVTFEVLRDGDMNPRYMTQDEATETLKHLETLAEETTMTKMSADRGANETKRTRATRSGTVAARMRELITEGGRTDEEIAAILQAEFPNRKNVRPYDVKYFRTHKMG